MKFRNPYLMRYEKLNLLARWLIFHSVLYYTYGREIITDAEFDSNAMQYVRLYDDKVDFHFKYVMQGFDGTTGMHLYSLLTKEDKQKILRDVQMFL